MLNARIILIVLLLLLNGKAESQTRKEFNAVNRVVLQIPDSLTYSTQNIANYIDSKFDKQKEKAMAIFCWIVENIQYDYNSRYLLDNSEGSNINNERTLKTRRGVCFNYSNLYCDIAKQVGIKTYR